MQAGPRPSQTPKFERASRSLFLLHPRTLSYGQTNRVQDREIEPVYHSFLKCTILIAVSSFNTLSRPVDWWESIWREYMAHSTRSPRWVTSLTIAFGRVSLHVFCNALEESAWARRFHVTCPSIASQVSVYRQLTMLSILCLLFNW